MDKKNLIAGNWKMNGNLEANEALVRALVAGMKDANCDVAVCVPAPYLAQVQMLRHGSRLELGAQDVSRHAQGAYTGEVSAPMLREFGVRYAIVGHSERRQYHGETDALVAEKAKAAPRQRHAVVCVGETLAGARSGQTEEVVGQLAAIHVSGHCISEIVVAYERSGRWAPAGPPHRAGATGACLLRKQLAAATATQTRPHPVRRQHERRQCGHLLGNPTSMAAGGRRPLKVRRFPAHHHRRLRLARGEPKPRSICEASRPSCSPSRC